MATGDFNRDGKLDLAVAIGINTTDVSILLGDGNGSFGPPNFFFANSPEFVMVEDFNRDGRLDLAVANPGPDSISILFGNGNGTFSAAQQYALNGGLQPRSIASADYNHDGKVDLAVADASSDTVTVLLGDRKGHFGSVTNFDAGDGPFSVASADINRDGRIDLAVADVLGGVAIIKNTCGR